MSLVIEARSSVVWEAGALLRIEYRFALVIGTSFLEYEFRPFGSLFLPSDLFAKALVKRSVTALILDVEILSPIVNHCLIKIQPPGFCRQALIVR